MTVQSTNAIVILASLFVRAWCVSRSFFVSSSSLLVVLGRSLLPPAWCFSRRNNNNNYSLDFFFYYSSRPSPRPLCELARSIAAMP